MKISVAVMDLGDSLAIPQTPCPLVHPLPRLVPKPTRSPARTSHAVDCSIRMMGGEPSKFYDDRGKNQSGQKTDPPAAITF